MFPKITLTAWAQVRTEKLMTNSLPSGYEHSTGFDRLAEPVRRWIWHKGWDSLRDIQERAIHIAS